MRFVMSYTIDSTLARRVAEHGTQNDQCRHGRARAAGARRFSVPSRARATRLRIVHGVTKEPELGARIGGQARLPAVDRPRRTPSPTRQVQAILLATPHSLHVEQVRMVAAAGKPVWCEKPLALTRARGRARGRRRDARPACRSARGNNKRCFASMRELKRVVESGEIGEVLHIEGHFSNEHSTRVSGGWRDDPRRIAGRRHDRRRAARARRLRQSRRADQLRRRAQRSPRSRRPIRAMWSPCWSSSPAARPACMAHRARGADVLALPCVRHRRLGGSARRGHADRRQDRRRRPKSSTFEHVDSLRVLLEAFADAVEGKAPFPVRPEQMLDSIGAFEASIASLAQGEPVKV